MPIFTASRAQRKATTCKNSQVSDLTLHTPVSPIIFTIEAESFLNLEKPFFLYISGGVNVEVPALTLSDPLQSSTGAAQKQGRAGLNLLAAAVTAAWLIQ